MSCRKKAAADERKILLTFLRQNNVITNSGLVKGPEKLTMCLHAVKCVICKLVITMDSLLLSSGP